MYTSHRAQGGYKPRDYGAEEHTKETTYCSVVDTIVVEQDGIRGVFVGELAHHLRWLLWSGLLHHYTFIVQSVHFESHKLDGFSFGEKSLY